MLMHAYDLQNQQYIAFYLVIGKSVSLRSDHAVDCFRFPLLKKNGTNAYDVLHIGRTDDCNPVTCC